MLVRKALVIIFVLNPSYLLAGEWTNEGKITEINQQQVGGKGSESVFITASFTSNPSDPTLCTNRNSFYFDINDDRKKRMFSMLLAAHMANKDIKLYLTNKCHEWGSAELDGVIVK